MVHLKLFRKPPGLPLARGIVPGKARIPPTGSPKKGKRGVAPGKPTAPVTGTAEIARRERASLVGGR
jgi:hypothetical protein